MMKKCMIEQVILRRRQFTRQQRLLFNLQKNDNFSSQGCTNHHEFCCVAPRTSRAFTSVTSTSTSDTYRQAVNDLIESKVGSVDLNGWREAQSLLSICVEDESNGVGNSLQILDRLSREKGDEFLLEKGTLNFVIANWKHKFIDNKGHTTVLPKHVFDMVKSWKSTNPILRPDTATYFMILEAIVYDAPRNGKQSGFLANSILEYMLDEAHYGTNAQPDAECFGAVMNAWVQSGDTNGPQMVENWIQTMKQLHDEGWPDVQPNLVVYNILLKALAWTNQIDKAENLLQDMLESRILITPDSISFTTLLTAYSKRGDDDAAEKAEQLLDQMHQLHEAGLAFAKPNTLSYTAVMQAHANAGRPDQAEALLRKLERLFQETDDSDWMPDETAYNTAILAQQDPERADAILHSMYEEGCVKPNTKSFNAVLTRWAKVGGAERAELILTRMHEMDAAGDLEARPDVVTYNIVLDAWAKSNDKDAWKRAYEILQHMQKIAESGDHEIAPNVRTWNTVLNCYAKGSRAYDALKIVEDFSIAAKDRNLEARPNVRTWNTVLAACLKRRDVVTAEQAWGRMQVHGIIPDIVSYNTVLSLFVKRLNKSREQQLESLNKMESVLKQLEKDNNVRPNKITCFQVIECWLKVGMMKRALKFLNQRCRLFATGDTTFCPDRDLYHKVLDAYVYQKNPKQAEAVLLEMADLHHTHGCTSVKPTVETYNRILNAWARSRKTDCGERTDQVLRQMQKLSLAGETHIAPDIVSINTVLKAWLNSGSPIAINKVEHLILELILKGNPELLPDTKSYGFWLQTIEASGEDDKGRLAREVLRTMQIHKLNPSKSILDKVAALEQADTNE